MTETIVLDSALQEKLEIRARQSNRVVNELLRDAIVHYFRLQDEEKLDREIAVFEVMHDELWQKYPFDWVAFHGQKLVDHDQDKLALYRRIRAKYPHTAVLMRQVKASPVEEIWIRSRFTLENV